MKLSEPQKQALAMVPKDWAKMYMRGRRLRGRRVAHPLHQQTFESLQRRGLFERRGGPGTWEWQITDAGREALVQ